MAEYDYDLFVIGAGSGGVRAGRMVAQLGKRVGVAEESRPGGTCVVRGCVPKKFLVYGADYGAAIREAGKYRTIPGLVIRVVTKVVGERDPSIGIGPEVLLFPDVRALKVARQVRSTEEAQVIAG